MTIVGNLYRVAIIFLQHDRCHCVLGLPCMSPLTEDLLFLPHRCVIICSIALHIPTLPTSMIGGSRALCCCGGGRQGGGGLELCFGFGCPRLLLGLYLVWCEGTRSILKVALVIVTFAKGGSF
jgi:hypothetical protein